MIECRFCGNPQRRVVPEHLLDEVNPLRFHSANNIPERLSGPLRERFLKRGQLRDAGKRFLRG
jgi:hypothetical protein